MTDKWNHETHYFHHAIKERMKYVTLCIAEE